MDFPHGYEFPNPESKPKKSSDCPLDEIFLNPNKEKKDRLSGMKKPTLNGKRLLVRP
jgi:hypothetical protein